MLVTVDTHRAINAVWKIESPKLVAVLTRMLRDLGLAEDLAQDALVSALEQWPKSGVPLNPGAWLMAAAKHRAIDMLRRRTMLERKHQEFGGQLLATQARAAPDLEAALDDDVGDDVLRLLFTACHPVLSTEARVALTLRLVGGLTTVEIARAFLTPEATIAQRIVRAKRMLLDKRVPFEVPRGDDRAARLSSVLDVIYLIFNEGYAATAGTDWMRPMLCDEALRVGRVLTDLAPQEAEVHGLVALMEFQVSRAKARVDRNGAPILLVDQDRGLWDRALIGCGAASLARAERCGGTRGTYTIQGAIASVHAQAPTAADTDWSRIVRLYDEFARLTASPVVALNHAIAVSMAVGTQAGFELVEALASDPVLTSYHYLPNVRGDLLAKLGRFEGARRSRALFESVRDRTRCYRTRCKSSS